MQKSLLFSLKLLISFKFIYSAHLPQENNNSSKLRKEYDASEVRELSCHFQYLSRFVYNELENQKINRYLLIIPFNDLNCRATFYDFFFVDFDKKKAFDEKSQKKGFYFTDVLGSSKYSVSIQNFFFQTLVRAEAFTVGFLLDLGDDAITIQHNVEMPRVKMFSGFYRPVCSGYFHVAYINLTGSLSDSIAEALKELKKQKFVADYVVFQKINDFATTLDEIERGFDFINEYAAKYDFFLMKATLDFKYDSEMLKGSEEIQVLKSGRVFPTKKLTDRTTLVNVTNIFLQRIK